MKKLIVEEADKLTWDDAADVIVVGLGAAGACAALQAHYDGASVILADKFEGGGATALSGGVLYAGNTPYQCEAGFEDSVDEMFKYLSMEIGDIITPETLRRFCTESAGNLEWLTEQGVSFGSQLAAADDSYDAAMSAGASLYYSGNEYVKTYAALAKPAPRGHITVGPGFGSKGIHLYTALRSAIDRTAIKLQLRSSARRLIVDAQGNVIGVEFQALRPDSLMWRLHRLLEKIFHKGKGNMYGPPARVLLAAIAWAENRGKLTRLRARAGVILATGGFINNRKMLAQYLPQHLNAIPMGSAGCLGEGIRLGQSVGARVRLDRGESGRTMLIPKSFKFGLLVNSRGERFIAEDAYGLTIGHEIFQQPGEEAWLILDSAQYRAAWGQVMPWKRMILRYRMRALMPIALAWRRARTLDRLARRCRIDPMRLIETFQRYNALVQSKEGDWLGKLSANATVLGDGPYYAINCSPYSKGFPPTSLTLGGMVVDEVTGQVCHEDGGLIGGLYAAGRAAIGLPSNFNVSGLSLADCVFSGRRAGRSTAARAASAAISDGRADELAQAPMQA